MKGSVLFLLLHISFNVFSQPSSVSMMLQEAKKLDETAHEDEALQKYLSVLKLDPENYEATWNTSLLFSKIGNRQTDNDRKKEFFRQASQYASTSLKQNSSDAESSFAMAVALGRMALISSPKEKVAASRDIKKYAELAIKLNPNHAGAWHVLGKWNYEVANLNFAEKAAAEYLFGGIPEGTLDEAVKDYLKAIKLDPEYILYYLDLAYALEDRKSVSDAKRVINQALQLTPKTQDDPTYLMQCKQLLKKLD